MAAIGRRALVPVLLCAVGLLALPAQAQGKGKGKGSGKSSASVAIFPVSGEGVSQKVRNDMVKWVNGAVNRVSGFSTKKTAAATRKLTKGVAAAFESCTEANCAVDLGKAVKARYAVLPRLAKTDKSYRMALTLIDVDRGGPVRGHLREKLAGEAGLKKAIGKAVKSLLTGKDPALTGKLNFSIAEDGAWIYIDDVLSAMSPVEGPIVVADGIRRIRVEKQGFKPWRKVMPVPRRKTRQVVVELEAEGDAVAAAELPPLVGIQPGEDKPAVVEAKTEETPAVAEAKPEETPAVAEAKPEETPAVVEAKPEETPAVVEAKPEETPAVAAAETAAAAPPGTEKVEPAPGSGPPSWIGPVAYGLLGAAALSVIGGGVYTSKAKTAEEDGSDATIHNRANVEGFQDDADSFGAAAGAFWGLTGVFAAAGLGLLIWDLASPSGEAQDGDKAKPSAMLFGGPTQGGAAVGLRATW